jgi:hypothetical protein
LCREHAVKLHSRFGSLVNMVGIIKEVAPVKGAATDNELGVAKFEEHFPHTLYMDRELNFYAALGNRSILSESLPSWNPFTLWSNFQTLKKRISDAGVEGNYAGEGSKQGAVIVIKPSRGIVYLELEHVGHDLHYDEIAKALSRAGVSPEALSSQKEATSAYAESMEGKTCEKKEDCS